MEMSVNQLKTELKKKVEMYKNKVNGDTSEEWEIDCHIGTKKLEITLHGGGKGTSLSLEIEYIRENWMMCYLNKFTNFSWYSGDNEDVHLKKLLEFALEYLKKYAESKKLHGFFIGFDNLRGFYQDFLLDTLKIEGFEEQDNKMVAPNSRKPEKYFAYCFEDAKNDFHKIKLLEDELNRKQEEMPVFVVNRTREYLLDESVFNINYREYYFEGNEFVINLLPNSRVLVHGREVEMKEYVIEEGVVTTILNDIEAQNRLYHLINPPSKFTTEMLQIVGYLREEEVHEIIVRCDSVVGNGKTEHDMKIVSEVLNSAAEKTYTWHMDKLRENHLYKTYVKEEFVIYRVKADFAIWFIATYKHKNVFVFPSDKEELPKETLNFVFKNMEKDAIKYF